MAKTEDIELDSEGDRSFAHFILTASSGAVQADTSRELRDFLQTLRHRAQQSNGATGTFTLKFTFKLDDADQIEVLHHIDKKVPQAKRRKGVMYLTPGGHLTPDNPRQRSLPLMEVPKAPRTMTDISAPKGA